MFALSCFYKILVWDPKHTETLAMFFTQMFVVHLMRSANGTEVHIIRLAQPFEPLMNKNIMHQKIGESVYSYTQPDEQQKRH